MALEFLSSNRSSANTLSKLTITLSSYRKTGIKTNPKSSGLDGDRFNGVDNSREVLGHKWLKQDGTLFVFYRSSSASDGARDRVSGRVPLPLSCLRSRTPSRTLDFIPGLRERIELGR